MERHDHQRAPSRPSRQLYVRSLAFGWILLSAALLPSVIAAGVTLGKALLAAVPLGGLSAVLLLEWMVRKMGPAQGAAALRPSRRVLVPMGFEEAFGVCAEAVRRLPRAHLRVCDREAGVLNATVGRSLDRLGDRIQVALHSVDGGTEIVLASGPRQPFALFDYGRNESHITAVIASIEARSAS